LSARRFRTQQPQFVATCDAELAETIAALLQEMMGE